MANREALKNYTQSYLNADAFEDYCPNGLQIEGKEEINKIISGVSANLALIERAIDEKADAIFVHHGLFWKNDSQTITGAKRRKIALLLENNINLFAYHLPLDAHPDVGNNAQLGKLLGINNMSPVANSLLWTGELELNVGEFGVEIDSALQRAPLIIGDQSANIKRIAWCTGAAQGFIDQAVELGVDAYLTGEVSEQTPATALENDLVFISAGHHATERYGVQALCQHLSDKFGCQHQYIEIDNCV
ncbi:MAG TPA: Nif3-like dinuclear metal center hexameric protein [Candidatus Thioglobus sp.]|jgi:dinuclear metal center YbgI/SA1388 family protein|nr:Nif3-like dinuclear metal center hexameric protein [Candidatus Thioglobus sp.]